MDVIVLLLKFAAAFTLGYNSNFYGIAAFAVFVGVLEWEHATQEMRG